MAYMAAVEAFQPTLPARGATTISGTPFASYNFNPRSPRGGATVDVVLRLRLGVISTHAPREGSDPTGHRPRTLRRYFNPRSPRGERLRAPQCGQNLYVFQPTLPARGATYALQIAAHRFQVHFNPRSPRGERHRRIPRVFSAIAISTHAPREGSDSSAGFFCHHAGISTHAPREGSDLPPSQEVSAMRISPHAPREGSDDHFARLRRSAAFQPTLPARGATQRFPP